MDKYTRYKFVCIKILFLDFKLVYFIKLIFSSKLI